MIGLGYQKYAREMGLKIGGGIAYGSLRGYSATMREGSGWKQLTFNTKIPESGETIRNQLDSEQACKRFGIREVRLYSQRLEIWFTDTVGTMKRIRAFVDWFIPLLDEAGAERYEICDLCGTELGESGVWKKVDETAYHVHYACGRKLESDIRQSERARQAGGDGSYFIGFLGALLGALLGAVVWAAVYETGYVASIVGLLIAFLAVKGYELFRGRQGKGMTALILLAVVFGVAAGNLMAYLWEIMTMIQSGELPITMDQIPAFLLMLLQDGEFLAEAAKDLIMGLFFALLGAFGAIARAAKSVGNTKITDLK